MKKNVSDQLQEYIERVKHPDEQILAMEGWTEEGTHVLGRLLFGAVLSIVLLVFSGVPCLIAVLCPIRMISILLIIMAAVAAVAVLAHLPGILLTSAYLAVTDKAVYYCTGLWATEVYVWTHGEIAMIECGQKETVITSTHHDREKLEYIPVKTLVTDWKNLFLALTGKPLLYRWFPLTQYFAVSQRSKRHNFAGYYELAEHTDRLKISFCAHSDSALRDAFTAAVKKNPHIKIGYDGRPIE